MAEHAHDLKSIRGRITAPKDRKTLRSAVYGGIDGGVTTFAIVSGVAGAGLADNVIIILGVANVLADGFSMAAGDYLATKSDGDNLKRIKLVEERHIRTHPEGEKRELTEILRAKGLHGDVLEQATSMIASNRTAWINMMLVDEYGLSPTPPDPVTAAISTFIAFLTAGFVPLLPFLMAIPNPFAASAIATLAVFFLIGAAKSKWSNAHWSLCGLETLAIGAVTAGIAYAAGALLHLVAPL